MLINWKCARRLGSVVFLGIALASATMAVRADDVKDASGRAVAAGNIDRIVSIGGDVTEILYALGMDKRIVGIDTTSTYPLRATAEKASVGYMRQLSAEGVERWQAVDTQLRNLWNEIEASAFEYVALRQARPIPFALVKDVLKSQVALDNRKGERQATMHTDMA